MNEEPKVSLWSVLSHSGRC